MYRFRIASMSCGGCAKGVTASLRQADPQAKIDIQLDTREVAVTSSLHATRLEQAMRDAGWPVERVSA